jgi:hypothetical protein
MGRWTDDSTPDQDRPKGNVDRIEGAVEMLGPFSNSDRYNEARRRIEKLARTLNHRLAVENDAPLIAHASAKLEKMLDLGIEFSKVLNSLDDATRYIVRTGGGDIPGFPDFRVRRKDRNKHFPDWIHGDVAQFTASLNGFLSHVGLTAEIFADRFSNLGSNTNIYKLLIGTAREDLIQQGLRVFERFKPDGIRATVGGKLHQFLMLVFEYATGKPGEEHAKFDTAFKRMVGGYRSHQQAEAQYEKLFQEKEELSSEPATNMLRLQEIEAECEAVRSTMRASWSKFVPQLPS